MRFKNENHRKHYLAWMWLSENPALEKCEYQSWSNFECFACVENFIGPTPEYCCSCPINWELSNDAKNCCRGFNEESTIYDMWLEEPDLERRTMIAEVIAMTPWGEKK